MPDPSSPDPARDPEALAGAEEYWHDVARRQVGSTRYWGLPLVMAEYERLKRVEAAARAVAEHRDSDGWTAGQEDWVLDVLARELARPAGEDGGSGE